MHKIKSLSCLSLSLLSLLAINAYADTNDRIIVTKTCLTQKAGLATAPLSHEQDFVLISVKQDDVEKLALAKADHKTLCGGFVDVTEDWQAYQSKPQLKAGPNTFLKQYLHDSKALKDGGNANYEIRFEKDVNAMLQKINPQNMWSDLTHLTGMKDRYSNSDNGVKAAEWIKTQVETMAKNANRDDVQVYYVNTGSYKQPSVVAKFGNQEGPGIVVGGHMDTLSSSWENKPGADDDGSGSVTVLETARTLIGSGQHFKKPIYFIWYAAEEMGLVGSSYVVKDFKSKNIAVDAVLQLDMTGYAYKNDPTIYLISDYVNTDLTAFLDTLNKTYVKQPLKYTRCGYACSDHASWHKAGFKASMPFEGSFSNDNPYIHTKNDVMSHLSLDHMHDFAKLAVAFAMELAEPTA